MNKLAPSGPNRREEKFVEAKESVGLNLRYVFQPLENLNRMVTEKREKKLIKKSVKSDLFY